MLKDELEANTAKRREVMARGDYDAIDAAIDALTAARIGENAPGVGALAPAFSLPDASGAETSLDALLARGPVVLSFYRGGWCSYCNIQMRAFQKQLGEIRSLGAELIGVSPELPDETALTTDKLALTHPVLSDLGNAVARDYGLEFTVEDGIRPIYDRLGIDLLRVNGEAGFRLPTPGTFVIDQTRRIRYAFVDPDYRNRSEPDDVLAALREI